MTVWSDLAWRHSGQQGRMSEQADHGGATPMWMVGGWVPGAGWCSLETPNWRGTELYFLMVWNGDTQSEKDKTTSPSEFFFSLTRV